MFSDLRKTYGTKSIVPRTKGIIPKIAFESWMRAGSLEKAALHMMNQLDMYNKKTGKPFTQFGVRHAACRYIALNHVEVRPVLEQAWADAGVVITKEEWEKFVVDIAMRFLDSSKVRFMRWLEANPWAEDYDYIYARKAIFTINVVE